MAKLAMLKMNGMSNLRRTAAQTLLGFDVVLTADSDSDVLLQIATIYGDYLRRWVLSRTMDYFTCLIFVLSVFRGYPKH